MARNSLLCADVPLRNYSHLHSWWDCWLLLFSGQHFCNTDVTNVNVQEVDDNDYQTEESASDDTDSDIDLDENEEVASDVEVEGDEKRKRRVITKAYKVSVTFAKYSLFLGGTFEVIMQYTHTHTHLFNTHFPLIQISLRKSLIILQ